jgi:hypothetical protein
MRVTTAGPLMVGALTLAVAAPAVAAPPPNDNFADAQRVGIGTEYTGSLTGATGELGEPDHGGYGNNASVWFRYRAPRNGRLTVDTGGSEAFTALAVYRGSRLSTLDLIGADAWSSPTGQGATVRLKVHRHRSYRIAIQNTTGGQSDAYKLWLSDGGIHGKGVALTVGAGQTVDSVRTHGLRLTVSARRVVDTALQLRVSRKTAKHLHLKSQVIGRAAGRVDYGQALQATIELTHAARRALDGVASLHAKVRLVLPKSPSPDKVLTVPVVL